MQNQTAFNTETVKPQFIQVVEQEGAYTTIHWLADWLETELAQAPHIQRDAVRLKRIRDAALNLRDIAHKLLTIPTFLMVALILFVGPVYAQEDLTPPALLDVRFSPDTIDTGSGPVTVTVTIHVQDDLSGLDRASVRFRLPGTTQERLVEFNSRHLIDGTITNGHYQADMLLPQYSAYGAWELFEVYLLDNVGNHITQHKPAEEQSGFTESSDWPSLFNQFAFVVGANQPQQAAYQLFVPAVGR